MRRWPARAQAACVWAGGCVGGRLAGSMSGAGMAHMQLPRAAPTLMSVVVDPLGCCCSGMLRLQRPHALSGSGLARRPLPRCGARAGGRALIQAPWLHQAALAHAQCGCSHAPALAHTSGPGRIFIARGMRAPACAAPPPAWQHARLAYKFQTCCCALLRLPGGEQAPGPRPARPVSTLQVKWPAGAGAASSSLTPHCVCCNCGVRCAGC